jgi:6,7-dimethyl-8-ribityllumazine synthase
MATINKIYRSMTKYLPKAKDFRFEASNAEWNEEITEGLYNGS